MLVTSLGRGPSLKTELKKLKKRLETEFKTKVGLYKKHPEVWIGDRIADIAKQTGVKDVAKIIAIVGMTILVKKTIDTSEELRGHMILVKQIVKAAPFGSVLEYFPFLQLITPISTVVTAGIPKPEEMPKYEGMFPDWMDWLISFTLAYIIVEHFGSIMHATGNILSSVKGLVTGLLLGGGTVP